MRVRVAAAMTLALLVSGCGAGDDDTDAGPTAAAEDVGAEDVGEADADDDGADEDDADADGAGTGRDPAEYGLDADVTVLGVGDSAEVQWPSGTTFEVTLHDFVATEEIDVADFDGTDFGSGADSYLVDLAEAGEPELDTFFVADVTIENTGPQVPLEDVLTAFGVADAADLPAWGIWFAEGTDTPRATTLATGDSYSGRLVGDMYSGEHYILSFESSPDTVWVVDAAQQDEATDDAPADDSGAEADDELSGLNRDGYRFFELGETALVDSYDYDFEITVHDVTFTDTLPGDLADEPALKDNFFIAELTLRNTGDIRIPVQQLRPDLGLTDDLNATSNPTLPLDDESAVEELAPGEELTGRFWGDTRIHDSYYFGFAGTRGGMAQWIVPGQ